jgi:hypothetical protein
MRKTLQTCPATRLNKLFGQEPFASPTRPNGFIRAGNVILAETGDTIDRDLTDDEIKKVEERIGDYFSNWFDLLEMAINDVVSE